MSNRLSILSTFSALIAFAVLMAVAMSYAGGAFEYPLDDVYIHMAIAEQIAAGGYGVNPGEIASAGSSPIYPLLLLPFAGDDAQRWLPLMWNIVGLGAAAWLWGKILTQSGYGDGALRFIGVVSAILGPIALNMFGVAFTGMEHSLHIAACLLVVYGLLRMVDEAEMNAAILVGVFLCTALRLEGLALGVLSAIVVWRVCGLRPAVATAFAAIVPVALFVGALLALGLDPLPESVQAKLNTEEAQGMSPVTRFLATFQINIAKPGGALLLGLCVGMFVLMMIGRNMREIGPRSIAIALLGAGIAHLLFAQVGWMNRYEGYALALVGGGLIALAAPSGVRVAGLAVVGVLGAGTFTYFSSWTQDLIWNIRAIHVQPVQSARFAKDFAKVPVAVNDLGAVSWGNPNYVLDLWGLASADARHFRLENPFQGWADPLAKENDVQLAMIYEQWLDQAIGDDWVKLGELHMEIALGYLGDSRVSYYATAPQYTDHLVQALEAWVVTLPDGAFFEFDEGLR